MFIKTINATLTVLLLTSPVYGGEFPSAAGPAGAATTSLVGSPGESGPETMDQKTLVAALSQEERMGHALELQSSDLFTLEDQNASADDLDLKLPEDDLPRSDIPLTFNDKVQYFVNYFQTGGRGVFVRWLSRSERYIPMMKQVLKKEGLPEDLVFLAMIESGFSPHAYSVASAVGPWQFMSSTGKRYSLRIDEWIDERRDPLKSTVAAAMYLKELYGIFNKDWYLAAAGYNAGENKILRAINKYESRDYWQLTKGSFLKRETKDYVPRLLAAAIIAKDPARYGFADVAYLPPIEFDTVVIPTRTNLDQVAKICNVPYQTIRELNPELRKWCTPPEYPNYELKIPLGKKDIFENEYAKLPLEERFKERTLYTRYRTGRRDTLASIASRFGTSKETIAELNHLKGEGKIRGKALIVPVNASYVARNQLAKPERNVVGNEDKREFKKYYIVKKGDTLKALAKRFNVTERLLATWNNLKEKVALRPGKRIIIAKFVEKNGEMTPVAGGNG